MRSKRLLKLVLFDLVTCFSLAMASSPIVRVYSFDEALNETNLSKPRIYIQNLASSVPISNFYYYYYFTTENNKTPVLEDYSTPNSVPTLQSLGSNRYRIKFTFTGITIQPGQILPNAGGEIVGIRYTDWSPVDKSNDFSNNMKASFELNSNIPAYLYDNTLIYGNLPEDPANPPQPPAIMSSTGNFAVFSERCTDLRDRVKITGGNVGSFNYVELGCNDSIYGSILSKGNVFLREHARVFGDVAAGLIINTQNDVNIEGATRNYAQMELPVLPTTAVTIGTANITVPPYTSYTLTPGSYNSFRVNNNVILTIQPGEYYFREFILETNVTVICNVGSIGRINFNIKEKCKLGNGTNMTLPSGITDNHCISIQSSQIEQLYIGTDATIRGMIYAPDAEIHVYSRTKVYGSLYGNQVVVEPDVKLCKPPTLLSLSHSEGAMSPSFDPITFNYIAVIPNEVTSITVTPGFAAGHTVTVNGKTPETPVILTDVETDIVIVVNNETACGSTKYNLKVKRSANYQIFVNHSSVCPPGSETGLTWECGYKNLQQALNEAAKKGMEVWVKEGEYKPSVRSNPSDPRSATFQLNSGMEIKGHFAGTETEDNPVGGLTVLSGDVIGDDTTCTTWPPSNSCAQYRDDNLYHVVTVKGNINSDDIYLRGIAIERGNADGSGINCSGAGMLVLTGGVNLELDEIHHNTANCSGGGIYVAPSGSISIFKNNLVAKNVSQNGDGAGLAYLSSNPLTVDASVFDHNTTLGTSAGGSAIFFDKANCSMINSVVARNKSNSSKGAVLNNGMMLNVLNCTFALNTGAAAVSISNTGSATTLVKNSILWNSSGSDEVNGDDVTMNYSCVTNTNGYSGAYNFVKNPLFVNSAQPDGANGRWGDFDDGLRLQVSSPCRDASGPDFPPVDILTVERPLDYNADAGAYEFCWIDNDEFLLGRLDASGDFYIVPEMQVMEAPIINWKYIRIYGNSDLGRVLRVKIPKDKYTSGKTQIYLNLIACDKVTEIPVPGAQWVRVDLYKVDEYNGQLFFQSKLNLTHKNLLFVQDRNFQNWKNPWAYVIYMPDGAALKGSLPHSQF